MVMFSPAGKLKLLKHFANFIGRALVGRLTDNEKFYRDMFSTPLNALSSKRNVKQTRVWGHGYDYVDNLGKPQSNKSFYQKLQQIIPQDWGKNENQAGIKVRAFLGEFDPLARKEVQNQWLMALPQLKGHIKTYPDAGHFVEEHKYQDIAAAIAEVTLEND